jgi:RNA polymerase sigma-70 factor (ECF subfamily)
MKDMPGWQDLDDAQLVIAAKAGDPEAFGELYTRYAQVVFRFLSAHVNDRMDAEDLTEEVFMRVWRTLPSYQEQGVPFLAFLFRVARNALIDFYRRSARAGKHASLEANPLADIRSDPGDAAMANLEHQEIRGTLNLLRDDYRTVLVLRFLSDLSPEETAQVMERTEGAVRILQHRALAALRNLLEGSNKEE